MKLSSGNWKWFNQTSDNKIDSDYSQLVGQSGGGNSGEIIRGRGSRFTVYSVMDISQFGCGERIVFLVDGRQENNGDVSAVYVGSPVDEPRCFSPSGGILELSLSGPAKGKELYGGPILSPLGN